MTCWWPWCCDKTAVGFDNDAWEFAADCFADYRIIENVSADLDLLDECTLLMSGLHDSCGTAIKFLQQDWDTIKDWIEAGGRFYLSTEWENGTPSSCLADPDTVNDFLEYLGTEIRYEGGLTDAGTHTSVVGDANIASGLTNFPMGATAEVSGGTLVFGSWTYGFGGVRMLAAEQIGDGFLFFSGDSNNYAPTTITDDSCTFALRMLTWPSEDLL